MHIKNKGVLYHKIDRLGIINTISHIAFASVGAIWAIYLDSIVKNASYVGFINSFLTIASILAYFFIIPLVQKRNKVKLYSMTLFLYTISYLLFSEVSSLYAVIILGVIMTILASSKMTCFGIIVRDNTKDNCVSKNEGLMYTTLNLAWLIGPLVAGYIADKYGVNKVFLFAAGVIFLSLILFETFAIKDSRKSKKADKNIFRIFIEFFSSKDRTKAYILSGGGNFWWALIYTYIPIHMVENGLSELLVGYFLFAIVIPLILCEYYFSKLAGKIGFKKMFFTGFLLLGIISSVCFFISNIYILLGVLIFASFAVAMLEPTTEAYFLDIISESQRDKFYGPFSTTVNVNDLLGTLLGAVILLALPLKFVFIVFGIVMFIFSIISLTIRNVVETKRGG